MTVLFLILKIAVSVVLAASLAEAPGAAAA
ncbi:hypothetical protein QFZ42_001037 [Variovorax paradoxus]|nr:hypothetical protein [Variovorax paradoxus]